MAEAQIKLGYILDPFFQIENTNGKPVVGGHIEVFEAGTDTKYITYQNFDYTQNPFKIPLGSDGRAVVLGDSNLAYDVYIYDSFNNLIVSRLNVAAGDAGGVAGGGLRQVIHDDTMTGRGTQLSPLGVSPLTNLAVDDTMTAYEATVEGKESIVLGVNGDWFNEQFGSAFSGKLDTSSFNSAYYDIKGGLSSKVDWSAMSSYYNKNETYNYFLPRSAIDLTNYYTKEEVYNKNEVDSLLNYKQEKLEFNYDVNSAISAINGSALAGQGGGSGDCPWISGAKVIGDTITLTDNTIFQVLSSFDLSGYRNHCIGVKGSNFRFPNRWEIASGIAETNYFMPQSSMSGYLPISSFSSYTAYIQNNLNDNWAYTNSAYSLSINNFYNKLDVSAFSSWSATYSGNSEVNNYVTNNSSFIDESVNVVQTNSGKWNEIEVYEQNSGTYLTAHQDISNKLDTTAFSTVSGTFLTAHQTIPSAKWENVSDVVQTNSAQWAENDGDTEVNNYVYNNSAINNEVNDVVTSNSGNWNNITGLNGIKNYDLVKLMKYSPTGDTLLGQIYPVDSADNLTFLLHDNLSGVARYGAVELTVTGVPTLDDMTAYQPVSSMTGYYPMTGNPSGFLTAHQIIPSSKWEDASDTVQTHSATWEENTGDTAVNLYVYNNSALNIEVNNVVTANSADWNTVTGKLDYSAFTAYTGEDNTYLLVGGYNIGISSDDNEKTTTISYTGTNGDEEVNNVVHTNSAQWAENTGDMAVNNFVYDNSASITNVNNSGALWNAVYDLVATYSAKWLINGDV
jgi:hypothetical protein